MQPDYLAYMLRMWQVEENGQRSWQASLEKPGSEERLSFSSINDLLAFLQQQTEQSTSYSIQHQLVEKQDNKNTAIEIKITINTSGDMTTDDVHNE